MTHFRTAGAFAVSLAACVSIVVAGASDSARADEAGHWAAIVRPAPAYDRSVVVYRPATHQLIEFGGLARGHPSNDVRTFSLDKPSAGWRRLEVQDTLPPARYGHVGTWDPLRSCLVVFGGRNTAGTLTDAWTLDLSGTPAWHALPAGAGPPTASYLGAAIYDAARDRLLYFGGSLDGTAGITNQLWALPLGDDSGWQALSPAGSVPTLTDHTMIYDTARDVAVVFGGRIPGITNNVYQLALEPSLGWSAASTTNPKPAARTSHSAIYDAADQRMVIWGGVAGSTYKNDAWTLALDGSGAWTQFAPAGSAPSARQWPRSAWDEAGGRMLTTSAGDAIRGDVLALSLGSSPAWSTLWAQPVTPTGGHGSTLLLDTARRRLYLFDPYTSVYRMSLDSLGQWTNLAPTGHPPDPNYSLRFCAVVFDSARNRLLLDDPNGLWQLPLASAGAAWAMMPVSPWNGDEHSLVLDPARDRLVRFGGFEPFPHPYSPATGIKTLNLAPLGAWAPHFPGGDPEPVANTHRALLDPPRDRMLTTTGGDIYPGPLIPGHPAMDLIIDDPSTELYALNFSPSPTWHRIPQSAPLPMHCERCGFTLDTNRNRLIRVADYYATAWAAPLGDSLVWQALAPSGTAPAWRREMTAVYDATGDHVFAYGGGTSGFDDTLFVLEFGSTTVGVPTAPPAPTRFALSRLWPNPVAGDALRLEIATPRAGNIQLEVFDLAGRRVASQQFNAPAPGVHLATLALGERLGAGVFWLRASTERESRSVRFVRVR